MEKSITLYEMTNDLVSLMDEEINDKNGENGGHRLQHPW